jgi:ATP-dependent 26S proteasome regulatory subunit
MGNGDEAICLPLNHNGHPTFFSKTKDSIFGIHPSRMTLTADVNLEEVREKMGIGK